jgi:DNA-binding response OmpR family regulator
MTSSLSKLVIYVDDDPEDRMIMEDAFLNVKTHHLMTLPHGNKLLDYLQAQPVTASLIILDINMPFLSGLDVLRLLKSESKYRNIPVVMFTTSSSSDDALKAKEYGADLIVKPVSYRDAVKAITGLLEHSA